MGNAWPSGVRACAGCRCLTSPRGRGRAERSFWREHCAPLPPKCHRLGFYFGPLWAVAGGLALHVASTLTSISAPCSGRMDRLPAGTFYVAGSMGRTWGEGFLFSVPAVFLLFNLNSQPLQHSCIPESGGGCGGSWGPPGRTWGLPTPSSLFRERSFLCAAVRPVSRASSRLLRGSVGRGSQVLLGLGEQAAQTGAHTYSLELPAHPSSSHQCVKCNDLFKSKSLPPIPVQGLSKHCLPPPVQAAGTKSSTGEGRPWVEGL
ncbi:hypothetical protein MC885_003225 [Smutsia gigantea]|nr:hypothetical protein MC885_003225 [Smutsia gigantea]